LFEYCPSRWGIAHSPQKGNPPFGATGGIGAIGGIIVPKKQTARSIDLAGKQSQVYPP